MRLTVSLGEPLSRVIGRKHALVEVERSTATLADAWDALLDAYPALRQSFAHGDLGLALFLNGESAPQSTWAGTPIHDGDCLQMVFPVGGG